jgi:hypothetical protein
MVTKETLTLILSPWWCVRVLDSPLWSCPSYWCKIIQEGSTHNTQQFTCVLHEVVVKVCPTERYKRMSRIAVVLQKAGLISPSPTQTNARLSLRLLTMLPTTILALCALLATPVALAQPVHIVERALDNSNDLARRKHDHPTPDPPPSPPPTPPHPAPPNPMPNPPRPPTPPWVNLWAGMVTRLPTWQWIKLIVSLAGRIDYLLSMVLYIFIKRLEL